MRVHKLISHSLQDYYSSWKYTLQGHEFLFHSIQENGITLQYESFIFGAEFKFLNIWLDIRFYNEIEISISISNIFSEPRMVKR